MIDNALGYNIGLIGAKGHIECTDNFCAVATSRANYRSAHRWKRLCNEEGKAATHSHGKSVVHGILAKERGIPVGGDIPRWDIE